MLRRLLLIAGIGLALVLGARLALAELTERAWAARRERLLELALFQPELRRPWELRFESLSERLHASPRFEEIARSPYRPNHAWDGPRPRPLDEFQRVWLESLWGELMGLDGMLAGLRMLPLEDLVWNGPTQRLRVMRELTNGLCGRAWLALEAGDTPGALQAYADALRLARATDAGSTFSTMVRGTSEHIVLVSLRSAVALGLAPDAALDELAPLLEAWAYSPERAERVIRRDLSFMQEDEELAEDPRSALAYFAELEEALEIARQPLDSSLWSTQHGPMAARTGAGDEEKRQWSLATWHLHSQHSRRNVALTALAVAAHRARHGTFPRALAELTDLAPEAALDPLTGKPLPYSSGGESARIGPAAWGVREDVYEDLDGSPYVWTLR